MYRGIACDKNRCVDFFDASLKVDLQSDICAHPDAA